MCLAAIAGLSVGAASYTSASADDLVESGHWKRSLEAVQRQLRSNPNDARAYYLESRIKEQFGDLEGAAAAGEKAIALEPRNADYRGQLAECYAMLADKSSIVKGWVYVRKMRREFEATYALNPKQVDALLVEMMFSWKAPPVAGGDKRKAHAIADRLVGIDPVWGYLAQARLAENEHDDARMRQALEKAVHANPGFYRAHIELATYYCCIAKQPKLDQAEAQAREALKMDPSRVGAWDVLARVAALRRQGAELDSILEQAEKAVPDDLSPYYSAALMLEKQGQDFDRARRYLQRYLSQSPEGRAPSHAEAKRLLAQLR